MFEPAPILEYSSGDFKESHTGTFVVCSDDINA